MSHVLVLDDSNSADRKGQAFAEPRPVRHSCESETTHTSAAELIEAVIFRECICMVSNAIRSFVSQKYRNVIDTEQIAVDVLDIVIRKFRNHPALGQLTPKTTIPVAMLIEIRAYCHRVEKGLVANAVRDARARKRGLGIVPASLEGTFEPSGTATDPALQAECTDTEDKLRSKLGTDQQLVLRCRKSMMSNVEISEETSLSLRSVVTAL